MRTVTYEQRAFDGIALAAANSPNTQEESTGDSNADQDSIDITELRESGDSPKEVDRA